MKTHQHGCRGRRPDQETWAPGSLFCRWFFTNSLVAGLFALVWLVLRSGPKPSRLAYPCQQVSLSAATMALGAPLVSALIAARRQLAAGIRTPAGAAIAAVTVAVGLAVSGYVVTAGPSPTVALVDPPRDYRASVFHVSNCPQDPVGD